jgi:DNA-directed RNA polymerase subunit beta'
MAVYLPLSDEAQAEARDLMAANKNLLKPQNGDPIVSVKTS